MKQNQLLKKYKKDGFVVIRRLFNKKQILEVLDDLKIVKKKASKLSKKFYHKTSKDQFNSIHNINTFMKVGNIIEISRSSKIINLAQNNKFLTKFISDYLN